MSAPSPPARALLAVAFVLTLWPAPLGAQEPTGATPGRLLVFSVPGLTWADVEATDLPHLERFFATAGLADLAPRGVSPRSGPGDAYLTISAGSRAATSPSVDGHVLALDEQSSGSAAGEIFRRRTGVVPDGTHVALAWPALIRTNARQPYTTEPGLLAEALESHGVSTTVIGNADGTDSIGATYERHVGLAVADTDGVVADGRLGKDLLVPETTAPFGVRLDLDAVEQAFEPAWAAAAPAGSDPGGMVLVEASDLARLLRYRSLVDRDRYEEMSERTLRSADDLFGRLIEEVHPDRDTVLVVAPYNREGDRDLTVIGLRRPGWDEGGYLISASTQRAGLLTLVDVAPTILRTFEVPRPDEMEGRPAELRASTASLDRRVDHLVALNAESRFRERLLVPTTVAAVVVLAVVTALSVVALIAGRASRWGAALATVALFDIAILPASYLARGFPLEDWGTGFYWAFTLGSAAVIAAAATMLARRARRPLLGLGAVLGVVVVVLCADVMTGSNLSLSAAFGYSPTGNSRLYGISNYAFGQLSAAAFLLAAFAAANRPPGRSRAPAYALLVVTLVVLGVPVWGSDVGGVLAFTPAILVFTVALSRRRLQLRTVVAGGAATIVAIAAFGFLDLARPPEERAHLGRLFERVGNEGLTPLLNIMERKLLANLRVSASSLWVVVIPLAVAFMVFLLRYPGRPIEPVRRRVPTIGAGLVAALVAAVLGSLVNDSGAIVGGVAALVVTASLVVLTMDSATEPLR